MSNKILSAAVVNYAPEKGSVEIREIARPEIGEEDVLLEVVSETAAVIDPNNPMSRRGLYNLDPTRKGFGYGVNGAMTRYVRVPARCLHRVPDQLAFEQACLTEPCCVAFNAVVENSRLKPGDRVIVLGPGTIGILCAAVARLCGAEGAVMGLETDRHRLAIAAQYGFRTLVAHATQWA